MKDIASLLGLYQLSAILWGRGAMDCDPKLGSIGHDGGGGDDITYGKIRWRRFIGDTKNRILES